MGMMQEFKDFATRGNVMDMAIGIIIGASFGKIVTSFVGDMLMPPISLLMGKVDFSNMYVLLSAPTNATADITTLAGAKAAGAVTLNYGLFINNIIDFAIIAFAIFLMIMQINKLRKQQEAPKPSATSKECPFCCSAISLKATKCPNCTSQLKP